jgi:hypothetical protein
LSFEISAFGTVTGFCEDAALVRSKEIAVASLLNPYLSFKDNARQAMEFYETSSAES